MQEPLPKSKQHSDRSQTSALDPKPCCLFSLMAGLSLTFLFFRFLYSSGLSSQADNDLCPQEFPGKTTNLQVKGRGYIWKLPFEKMLSAALSLCAPLCHHSRCQTCQNMGSCQLGRPLPAVLSVPTV